MQTIDWEKLQLFYFIPEARAFSRIQVTGRYVLSLSQGYNSNYKKILLGTIKPRK